MTELSKETVKRIEDDADNAFPEKLYEQHGYIKGATAEATRSMIVEAEKDKELYEERKRLEGYIQDKDNKIGQLTAERDAYKEALEKAKAIADKYFAMNPRVVREEDEVYKIFTEVLNQFNNTEKL